MFLIILKKHLHHLCEVFNVLIKKNIYLFSEKFFLNYSSVHLLDQKINVLSLATLKDKLWVIISLKFSCTLTQLKKYLNIIRYLCQYISHYIIIMKSLQLQKTLLNKEVRDIEDNVRKCAADRTDVMKFIFKELNSFHQLQTLFNYFSLLTHFDFKCQLYIDFNMSKEFDFGAHVYHIKEDIKKNRILMQKSIESILFLSCLFINVKTQYWLTELKIANLVWMIKKVQHIIKITKSITIIYTDHSVTVAITR